MQPQPLDERARLADEELEHVLRLLRQRVGEHLDLVELVAADHPALLLAVGARLAPVARRVGEHLERQVLLLEDLAAVEVHERRLRRRQQELEALLLEAEDVLLELRELPGGEPALVGQQVRREDELEAVLEVLLDEVVEERPLEPRAHAAVEPEAVAAHADAAVVVDEPERRAELDVVLRLEALEDGLLAPDGDDLVGLLAAGDDAGRGEVREREQDRALLLVDLGRLLVERGDAVAEGAHLGLDGGRVLAGLLRGADLLRRCVALVLERLDGGGLLAADGVEGEDLVDGGGIGAAGDEALLDGVGGFADLLEVEHGCTRGVCVTAQESTACARGFQARNPRLRAGTTGIVGGVPRLARARATV